MKEYFTVTQEPERDLKNRIIGRPFHAEEKTGRVLPETAAWKMLGSWAVTYLLLWCFILGSCGHIGYLQPLLKIL